jgi:hypothetical protein
MPEFIFGNCSECHNLCGLLDDIEGEAASIAKDRVEWTSDGHKQAARDYFNKHAINGKLVDTETGLAYTSADQYVGAIQAQLIMICEERTKHNQTTRTDTQLISLLCSGPVNEDITMPDGPTDSIYICSSALIIDAIRSVARYGESQN